MPDTDRIEIERILQEGSDALTAALANLDGESAHRQPYPGSWSILDCVEHIAITEGVLLAKLREARPAGRSHADPAREVRFRELALNRARHIDAPPPVCPARTMLTLDQACDAFHAIRGETLRFLHDFRGDLRSSLVQHPLITRPVNCYEMLLLIAFHPRRHAQQIVEIREQLSPPRGPIQ